MPRNLVLVRHGESEGNIAGKRSKAGDHSHYTPEFRLRHSSTWRLTDLGIRQAQAAGKWLRENLTFTFGRQYTSEYNRAMETAYYLERSGKWYVDFNLRERDRGVLDVLPHDEQLTKYPDEAVRRDIDSFFWTPLGGESMAMLCLRQYRVMDTFHRECSNDNVLSVNHGEVIWSDRVLLERMTQRRYHELDTSDDPHDHIHNGQIIHYTRISPYDGSEHPYYMWMRSICPWDLSLSRNIWEPIVRPKFTNEGLMEYISLTPRMIAE